jgi:hypothetical protein
MRQVAGGTLSVLVWFMGKGKPIRQIAVATQTAWFQIIGNQTFPFGRMGFMTSRALKQIDGFMHNAAGKGFCLLAVTGIAEPVLSQAKEVFIAGYMRIMAQNALTPLYRLMNHLIGEQSFLMTGKAVSSGPGQYMTCGTQQSCRNI